MPFNRPSLTTLITRTRQDAAAQLPGTDPTLRRSLLRALTTALAGLAHGIYGGQQWIANQVTVLSCDLDTLADFGRIYQVPQKDATLAGGNAVITGIDGTDIPAGSEFLSGDGQLYTTNADATPAGGTVTVAVTAETAGAAGNQDAAALLTFTSPIAGITNIATVDGAGLAGGADIEDIETWRQRIKTRIGNPPGRWLDQDYIDLATSQAGVTRAWAYPNELDLGMMTIRFVEDDGTGSATIIPAGAAVIALQAVFDAGTPAFGPATVAAPIADVTNFTIAGIVAAYQPAVEAEIRALFSNRASPGGTLPGPEIVDAIEQAVPSGTDWSLTLPVGDIVPASSGHMPTVGVFTFT